jgi:hypothetical protein
MMEDETRGRSRVINPRNYKKDVFVQSNMESRHLATVSNWLDANGSYTRHLGGVASEAVRILAEMIAEQGQVEFIDDQIEARALLQRKYGVNLNSGGRLLKNVFHNTLLDENRREMTDFVNRGNNKDDADRIINKGPTFNKDKILADLAEADRRAEEKAKAEGRKFLDGLPIDKDGNKKIGNMKIYKDSDIPRKMTEEELGAKAAKHAKRDEQEKEALSCIPEGMKVVKDDDDN